MRRPRRADIALAVIGAIAVAILGVALWPRATPTVAVAPSTAKVDRPMAAETGRPTALIIGDAYTSGSGLAEMSYGCMAAARTGWLCTLAAEPGTGYISGGTANRFALDQGTGESTSFGERITRLGGLYRPDVVILDGGRDDIFAPPATRFEVTASTIWQVRQTWPSARIVFVAPRFLGRPDDDLGVDADAIDLLRKASGVDDLVVADPIASFKDNDTAPLIARDGTNPNAEGQRALAAALADELSGNRILPAA